MSKLVLLDEEVSLIKGLFEHTDFNIQQVQAIFSYLERNINTREIGAIKREQTKRYQEARVATADEIGELLRRYTKITVAAKRAGFLPECEESAMIHKAIEIMKSAILIYNNNAIITRSEIFIVLAVIAWTYVLHTFYKREGITPIYLDTNGEFVLYDGKHPKFWELSHCVKHKDCPLSEGAVRNLKYIIEVRNEVEHRSSENIDEDVQSKLQATALNFVGFCKKHFGDEYDFSADLAFTIQLNKLTLQSPNTLKGNAPVSKSVAAVNALFDEQLTAAEYNDPEYAFRVYVVPKSVNNPSKADQAVTYAAAGSKVELAIKNVERPKFLMKDVIPQVRKRGFPHFTRTRFIELFNEFDLKNQGKGLAIQLGNSWFWYQEGIDKLVELLTNERQG
ncbi:MAG: DUF3644 domain-containing protein [Pseudomonadota bacterium]